MSREMAVAGRVAIYVGLFALCRLIAIELVVLAALRVGSRVLLMACHREEA
jgi:hypothetical protein